MKSRYFFILGLICLAVISPSSAGVVSRIKESMPDLNNITIPHYPKVMEVIKETMNDYQLTNLTNIAYYTSKGVIERIRDSVNDYQLANISLPLNYSPKGVLDRIRDTMSDYHPINITIPAQYTPKGIWSTLMNTRLTFHVPQIPVVSSLFRRNTTEDKQPTTVSPSKVSGFASETSNWCGGNVLLDLNSRKEVTYKSTNFPGPRTSPYACSWDVKVAKNCKKGLITLTLDERSRLAEQEKCLKGYFRITPFMKEAKLCGPIGTAPAFKWYVDQENSQPNEEVSIIMKNIGLNDGRAEGVAFSIKGECLDSDKTEEGNEAALVKNLELSTRWMNEVIAQSKLVTRKKGKDGVITLFAANMSLAPVSKLSSSASEKVDVEHFSAHSASPHAVLEPITDAGDDPGLKPNNVVLYSPLYLLFKRFGLLIK